MNSKSHAIVINSGSNANTFYSNKLVSTDKEGLVINQDSTPKNNMFSNNLILNSGTLPTNSPKSIQHLTRK